MNKQIQLLIESAEMWVEGDWLDIADDPLCMNFRVDYGNCTSCPVKDVTCADNCDGTIYPNSYEIDETKENCQAFGEWLNCLAEELLLEKHNSEKE